MHTLKPLKRFLTVILLFFKYYDVCNTRYCMNVIFCNCLVFFYIRIYLLPSVLSHGLSQNRFHFIGVLSHGKENFFLFNASTI